MEHRLFTNPKNILYITIALGIGTFSGIKLYKAFEEIKTQKNVIRDRLAMDSFYEHDFTLTYVDRLEYPQTYNSYDPITDIESKMISDGYKNAEISQIRASGFKKALIWRQEDKEFDKWYKKEYPDA